MYFTEKGKPVGLAKMDSTWGEHTSPFVQYDAADYASRNFPVAQQFRGTSRQPALPRPMGIAARYGDDNVANPTPAPPEGGNKIVWLLLFGLGFLLAYHMGKAAGKGARSNPGRRRRRASYRPARRGGRRGSFARARPRNELGQFLPLD